MNHKKIEKILGVGFKNKNLLTQVFIHRSYLNEHPEENLENNERLEFLGDAILSFIVSESFFKQNKKANEGQLTTLRSQAVRTETLAKISEKLGLGDFMLLSKGEDEGSGRKNPSLLANVFEAFIAAIYIEYGIEKVKDFINVNLFADLEELTRGQEIIDFKSQLQKVVQEQTHLSPNYKLISESGPEHKKTFEIGVFSKQKLLGKGKGFSKQQAQQQAAFDALKKLGLTS